MYPIVLQAGLQWWERPAGPYTADDPGYSQHSYHAALFRMVKAFQGRHAKELQEMVALFKEDAFDYYANFCAVRLVSI